MKQLDVYMYSFRVSNRIKYLHKVELIKSTEKGKSIVNIDYLPLVFRTDNVARQIGKRWAKDMNNSNDTHSLYVQGQYVMSASIETIESIIARWKEQRIELEHIEVDTKTENIPPINHEIKIKILNQLKAGGFHN